MCTHWHTYIHTCKLYLCDPLVVECYFKSTETVGLLGMGAQDGHPDFHTAPEVCDPLPLPQFKYSFPSCFPPPILPPLSNSIFKYSTFYSLWKGRSTPSSPSKCEWLIWIADHNKFYGFLFCLVLYFCCCFPCFTLASSLWPQMGPNRPQILNCIWSQVGPNLPQILNCLYLISNGTKLSVSSKLSAFDLRWDNTFCLLILTGLNLCVKGTEVRCLW